MDKYAIYQAVQDAISATLPTIVSQCLQVKSKVDALPDYPTQSEAASAIGMSLAQIRGLLDDGTLTPAYVRGVSRRRVHKSELISIVIPRIIRTNTPTI